MYIPKEKTTQILALVSKYKVTSERNFSVDDFLHAVQKAGHKVRAIVSDLSEDSQAVKGYFVSKQDGASDIVLLRELNYCWKRLVLCKEICHVLLDSEEYRSMDIASLIEESVGLAITETKPSNALLNEIMAEVAAMELLFPYHKREQELMMNLSSKDIAEKFKCPQLLVEKYLFHKNMEGLKDAFSASF